VDGGLTWHPGQVPGADSLQFRDVHAVDSNTAYLLSIGPGEASRIYKTTNAGRDWTLQFRNANPKAFYDCLSFWDERRGLAIGDVVDDEMFLLSTNDGGAHWTPIPSAGLPAGLAGEGSFAASGTCLVTRPGGRAWMVMSNRDHARLLHTTNYGTSWTLDTLPVTTRDGVGPQSVAMRDDRNGMVLGGGYGAQPGDTGSAITHDGGNSWIPSGRPALKSGIWGGVFIPNATLPTVVVVGPDGSAFSRDEGRTWTPIDSTNYWSVGFASPTAGWAVGMGGRITHLSVTTSDK
jgi:photosystem II stability/assembly factor-like uncharacterized protein